MRHFRQNHKAVGKGESAAAQRGAGGRQEAGD